MAHLVLGSRLTFRQQLDPATLARAVRLLLDAEPVLGCWFKEGLLGARWERCADLEGARYFSVLETDDPDRDAAMFHGEPFDDAGPRLAVRLLRTVSHDDLCLRVDHLVADGWATKELTYMLADTYSRLVADPSYVPRPNLAPRPSGDALWKALTAEQRAAASRGSARPVTNKWKLQLRAGTGTGLSIRRLTLDPEWFSSVKSYGKVRGATVTDMLLAALMRSLVGICPPDPGIPFTPSITSNARQFTDDPSLERVCVLAGSATPSIANEAHDDFDRSLTRVLDGVRPCKESLWGAKFLGSPKMSYRITQAVMALVLPGMFRSGTFPPIVMNIGVLDEERLSFAGAFPVAAHVAGSIPRGPGLGATISTYRDTLTVWMGNFEQDLTPELVDRVLRGMSEELAALRA